MTDQPTQPSFEEFNRRLSAMPDYEAISARSSHLARLGFAISLLAFALSILVTQLQDRYDS